MAEQVEIKVEFDIGRTSPNRHVSWQMLSREQKAASEAAWAAWRLAGSPRLSPPVVVSIHCRRRRPLDNDNLLSSCKHLLDGILCGHSQSGRIPRMLDDDGPKFASFGTILQSSTKPGERPSVTFTIESLDGD